MLSLILYFLAKDCQKPGQFKPVDGDQCSYIECLIQSEPWKDAYGNIRLDEIKRSCAPGVGVPMDYMSGYDNPCTIALNECQPIRKFYVVCCLFLTQSNKFQPGNTICGVTVMTTPSIRKYRVIITMTSF